MSTNSLHPDLDQILARVLPYVEQRRKDSGGYGATRRLPATIDDTYYALRILALFRSLPPGSTALDPTQDTALHRYLTNASHSLQLGISTRCHLIAACRLTNLPVDTTATVTTTLRALQPGASLGSWFYGITIIRDLLGLEPATLIDAKEVAATLAQPWRTIDQARQRLFIQDALQLSPDPSTNLALGSWLQSCQSGDGGFGFMPGTTSFIENCRHGLEALASLGKAPHDRHAVIAFICGCQTAFGGFSRKGHATAFLDSTWYALAALVSALTPLPSSAESL